MTLALVTLAALSVAPGVFKHTIAASDPHHTTLPWLLRHLPVTSAANSCPNETCTCGATGRTEVNQTFGFGHEVTFGIHTVLAAGVNRSREAASGHLSLAEVEKLWDEAIGDLRSSDAEYSSLLDNHVALWAASLDPFVASFEAGGVGFLRRTFQDVAASDSRVRVDYYSLVVHCAHSQLVVELISDARPHASTPWPPAAPGDAPRHFFQGRAPPSVRPAHLWPLHVSRAASDLAAVESPRAVVRRHARKQRAEKEHLLRARLG
jgi:hypothetical protein